MAFPWSGRQGRKEIEFRSGFRKRSEWILSPPSPGMAQPSMDIPCSTGFSNSAGIMVMLLGLPKISVNSRRMNATFSSLIRAFISSMVYFNVYLLVGDVFLSRCITLLW